MDGCLFRGAEEMVETRSKEEKNISVREQLESAAPQQSPIERKWKGVEEKDINVLEF